MLIVGADSLWTLNTHAHTLGWEETLGMNGADGSGKASGKGKVINEELLMLWMVESRQSFQIWRKASVKAWRGREEVRNRLLTRGCWRKHSMGSYVSLLLSSLVCNTLGTKIRSYLLFHLPTILKQRPQRRCQKNEGQSLPIRSQR